MAYTSSYDKFEDLDDLMVKSKQSKLYAKKRRPKCCGIKLGASYDVHSAMTSSLSTASSPFPVISEPHEDNRSRKRCRHFVVVCAIFACLAVGGIVGGCVFLLQKGRVHLQSGNESNRNNNLHDDAGIPFVLNAESSVPEVGYFSDFSTTLETTPLSNLQPDQTKSNQINTTAENANVEYVTPLKQGPKPLHMHDKIYDESRNKKTFITNTENSSGSNLKGNETKGAKVQVGDEEHEQDTMDNARTVHSGHFRDNTAEVFDPHPEYIIDAFGRRFVLELSHNLNFSPSQLTIVQIEGNYSKQVEKKDTACYYTGIVRGEAHSHVGVSLCNGMSGYIKTTSGDFQIEPDEVYNSGKHGISSIRHKMTKLPPPKDQRLGHDHDDIASNPISFHPLESTRRFGTTNGTQRDKRSIDSNRPEEERFYDDDINQQYIYHYGEDAEEDNEEEEEAVYRRNYPNALSSKPYFIEALIVADRTMFIYHKNNDDLTRYILTLMSHVSLLFKDATIGNPITLVVVDIMILYDKNFRGSTSSEVLKKFCEYQHKHSLKKHDVAVLLTRDPMCKNSTLEDGRCNTLGLAEISSICNPAASCAVVTDNGLSTSFTIAHELGHVLSMPHDEDSKCKEINNGTIPNNIMAKSLREETHPWHWSRCSQHFVTEFLNSPKARCLLDEPGQDHIQSHPFRPILPGETFEADRQCELEFGPGSNICSFMSKCAALWCTYEYDTKPGESGCKTRHMPWADGTTCDRNMWCLQGSCTLKNNFRPVKGGWGEFKKSGECTRTCGGGIQMYVRECNSPTPANGGPYCTGGSNYYESCNTEPCLEPEPDFREMQCAKFNGNSKGLLGLDNNVRWVPKYGTNREDSCKLYCRVELSTAYYLLENKVLDGTKCGLNSFDICVNGVCMKGGCDNRLNSNVTLDDCGVCGGENKDCCKMHGFYNFAEYGYHHVLRIPKGSSNIVISQSATYGLEFDENYLALREAYDDSSHYNTTIRKLYLLNGNSVISGYRKDIIYGGLTFRYSGSSQRNEYIHTPPKAILKKDVIVEVLQVGNLTAANIEWNYTIPCKNALNYSWEQYKDKWTGCSSICNGFRYPVAKCVDVARNIEVDRGLCAAQPLNNPVGCNRHCLLQWKIISKGSCAFYSGNSWRNLNYECVKVDLETKSQQIIDKKHCQALPEPERRERCEGHSCNWKYHEWSHCSKSCGGGMQERRAVCVCDQEKIVDDSFCVRHEKQDKQFCNEMSCPEWFYQEWSSCSASCGSGVRHRQVFCLKEGQETLSHFCDAHNLQPLEDTCISKPCPEWITGDWTDCNGHCGSSYQQRLLTCIDIDTQKKLPDSACDLSSRPDDTRPCELSSCGYQWIAGQWSDCSRKCGRGQRLRQVQCKRLEDNSEDDRFCDSGLKPAHIERCENYQCPGKQKRMKIKDQHSPRNELRTFRWQHVAQKCSTRCGTGYKTFKLECHVSNNGVWSRVVEGHCNHLPSKPPVPKPKPCQRYNCSYAWMETDWSPCSNTCGPGTRRREIYCNKVLRQPHLHFQRVSASFCAHLKRPDIYEECLEMHCNDLYHWKTSDWKACKQPCGPERRTRNVHCQDRRDQRRVPDKYCFELGIPKPRKRRNCLNPPCVARSCKELQVLQNLTRNDDYILKIKENFVRIHCYKMDTNKPEEFITLSPGALNFAEIYDKKLRRGVRTCPSDKHKRSFQLETMEKGGGNTTFWKVRLDIDNMKIIPDDFTFSKHTTLNRIPYGSSGDCYSSLRGCAKGKFHIDLSGTSFKLSPQVAWIAHGQSPTKRITKINKHEVRGLCGGNCGGCMTNPRIGLQVEVT